VVGNRWFYLMRLPGGSAESCLRRRPGMRQWPALAPFPKAEGMTLRRTPLLLLVLLASLPASAQFRSNSSLAPPRDGKIDEGWSGKGELGMALSRGNTESESLIGKIDVAFSSP